MASRGSAIQRFLRYVREADVDEMRVALQLAKEIGESRLTKTLGGGIAAAPKVKRTRKPRPASAAVENSGETLADA